MTTLHLPDSLLCSGNVLARKKTNGVWGNWVDLGIVDKFETKADAEKKDNISKRIAEYGQVAGSAVIPKPASISLSVKQITPAILEALNLGTMSEITHNTGSLYVTAANGLAAGDVIPIPYVDVSAVSVSEGSAGGGGALTLNSDYTVNSLGGYVKLLTEQTSGALVHYTYPNATGFKITLMTQATFIMGFDFRGVNLSNQRKCRVFIHETVVMPKSAADWLGNDYIKVDLDGTMITPEGYTEPGFIEYFD